MTYQDPNVPRQRVDTDPAMPHRAAADPLRRTQSGWNGGGLVGALVVLALIVAAIAYAMNRSSTMTATSGPSSTQSAPSTTGQGGSPVGAPAPSGTAR